MPTPSISLSKDPNSFSPVFETCSPQPGRLSIWADINSLSSLSSPKKGHPFLGGLSLSMVWQNRGNEEERKRERKGKEEGRKGMEEERKGKEKERKRKGKGTKEERKKKAREKEKERKRGMQRKEKKRVYLWSGGCFLNKWVWLGIAPRGIVHFASCMYATLCKTVSYVDIMHNYRYRILGFWGEAYCYTLFGALPKHKRTLLCSIPEFWLYLISIKHWLYTATLALGFRIWGFRV